MSEYEFKGLLSTRVRKMMLPLRLGTVWVWLNEDYELCLEGHYPTRGDIVEALCFIKGVKDG